jgi:AcrR family transcriptional regulator
MNMADTGTRSQILLHAARLFGQRGYYGTSTRDIAQSVGIRQPSLFYHFAAKHVILAELVGADLAQAMRRCAEVMTLDVSHAERFHLFLTLSSHDYLTLPFDARGFYSDSVFSEPEFAAERAAIERHHGHIEAMVESGTVAGEFRPIDPEFVRRAVIGLQFEAMRERELNTEAPISQRPLQVADFVLRAILFDPDRLESVGDLARQYLHDVAQ